MDEEPMTWRPSEPRPGEPRPVEPQPVVAGNNKTRACANCARLKMKCQWPEAGTGRSGNTCTRCTRMKLPCSVPEPSQKRKRGKSTRVAQLEQKIDGIVSLLAASQHVHANRGSPLTPKSPERVQTTRPAASQTRVGEYVEDCLPVDIQGSPSVFKLFPGFSLTAEQATTYLNAYRHDFMPKYPFVMIPKSKSANALYSESRGLFWTLMSAVAPQSPTVQAGVKKWFRQYIAEHVVVRQEKQLHHLQAILIHLGWGDFHFYFDLHATSFLQLAMSLIIDMRLDRAPDSMYGASRTLLGDAWANNSMSRDAARQKTSHTLADKRAVLCFYHITSVVNTLFRRLPQLQWTNYLSRCCDSLIETREYATDLYIAAIIKMERATERVHSVVPSSDFTDEASTIFRSTHDMAINAIRQEIQNIFNAQPDMIKQDKVFCAYHHVLIMRLYEPVIAMRAPLVSDVDNFSAEPFQRSEALWKGLQAAIDFFDSQLLVPTSELPYMPFTSTGVFAFVIVTTSRLVLLDSSNDWQSAIARKRLDFADIMARLANKFEEGDKYAEAHDRRQRVLDDGTNVFYKYAFKMRWVRKWYLSRVPQDQESLRETEAFNTAVSDGEFNQIEDFLYDDGFWNDLISIHDPTLLALPTHGHGPLQHSV